MNVTDKLFCAIDNVWYKVKSESVHEKTRKSFLDYLAVTSAGAEFQKAKLKKYFDFAELESGKYKVIGSKEPVAMKEAVFLNGLNAHALDYDDGTNSGIIHLGSPIFSLLVPLSQQYGISIDDMLRAATLGYEVSYTMAISIQPRHKELGFHATGTCGILGATIAAAYMLGFTNEECRNAFSAACVASSGMLKAIDDESELKPYNVAKASMLALTAIQMGKAGFKGSCDPLSGRGFFKMMTGSEDVELKPVMLNGTYAIQKTYTKPYASCRYTHPSVEAAIHLRKKVNPEEIVEIVIHTYGLAVSGHNHTDIPNSYSAKMSIPYATAAAILCGKAGLQEFSADTVKRRDILDLTKKIKVDEDEELSRSFPITQTAIVTIKTKENEYSERVDYPKGEPENPLSDDEFIDRYFELMNYASVDRSRSESVLNLVYNGDSKVEEILSYL